MPDIVAFPALVVCWPWHLRALGSDTNRNGATCTRCGRDVAAPTGRVLPVCIYCGIDGGLIPAVDVPFGGDDA